MLGYIFEWLVLMVLVGLVLKIFGENLKSEYVYLFTAIWAVANLCISLDK
ncbi:hypothetical protein ACWOBW_08875 [Gemella sanguinis]